MTAKRCLVYKLNFQHLPNATQKAKQAQLGSIQSRQAESLVKGGAAARPCGQMQYCRGEQFIQDAWFKKDAVIVSL